MMITAKDDEKKVGIEVFYTDSKGIGGKLRKDPEDFVVDEISSPPPKDEDGEFAIVKIRARFWETNRLIRKISRRMGISRKRIGFGGTKDKRAVTTQLFSIKAPVSDVEKLQFKDVEILEVYPSNKGLFMGDLIGNSFDIAIRDLEGNCSNLKEQVDGIFSQLSNLGGFPNFFGHQRFGTVRPVTHIVGRKIIEGDFKGAVHAYLGNPVGMENPESFKARKAIDDGVNYSDALLMFPKYLSFEASMLNHLAKNEEDYIGAINVLPKNLSMMFVHAYQSYLFNKLLSQRIRVGQLGTEPVIGDIILPVDSKGIPDHKYLIEVRESNKEKVAKRIAQGKAAISGLVPGAEMKFASSEQGEIERKILEDEGLSPEDFIIPQIMELSSKGRRRALVSAFSDLNYDVGEDEVRLRFKLSKGCYATSLLREFMKTEILNY